MKALFAFGHSARIAVASLGAYRLRSGLTALGVTIGVTTVIAILSIIEGLDNAFEDVVSTMGTGTVYVSNRPLIILGDWWKYKNRPPLVPSDAEYLDERLVLAQTVVPFVNTRVKVETGKSSMDEIRVIGTRHGEKLYESLVSREEMARADDLGGYYQIPADARDLNYDKYFVEGETDISQIEDYTSHNTKRLSVDEVKQVLLGLEIIRNALPK